MPAPPQHVVHVPKNYCWLKKKGAGWASSTASGSYWALPGTACRCAAKAPAARPITPQPQPHSGLVPNTARLTAVPPGLLPLLGEGVDAFRQALGERLIGVYLRGSAPQGHFLPGVSDLDLFALCRPAEPAEQRAAAELLGAAAQRLQAAYPACVKVELQAVSVPEGSPLLLPQGLQSPLPPSCLPLVPRAFQLRAQSVTLAGPDLPALLPDVAALPELAVLPGLVADVEAAVQHASEQLSSGTEAGAGAAAAAARWALKRCLRGAFELGAERGRLCTPDLYWCMHFGREWHPKLGGQLEAALEQYLQLSSAVAAPAAQLTGSERRGERREQRQAIQAATELATRLSRRTDWIFLQQMLRAEPGWLTQHGPRWKAPPPSPRSASALEQAKVKLWVATSRGGDLEGRLVRWEPPEVQARVKGPVRRVDWQDLGARGKACSQIAVDATPGLARAGAEPQLLAGAAAHWPAVRDWSLGRLARVGFRGRVRVAPSLAFPVCEPQLLDLLVQQQGLDAAPSHVLGMAMSEFAARLQADNPAGLPPLTFSGLKREGYYAQADLPPELEGDVDLVGPPFAAAAPGGRAPSQPPRLWVSPGGAVSPLHFDKAHSFLVQLRGRKRMLLWPPDQLPCLYPYPDTHLLRRRSRVNLAAPDLERFPLLSRTAAVEAVLAPGDVLFFPSRWAHYTESLAFSISLTCRFGLGHGGGGQD